MRKLTLSLVGPAAVRTIRDHFADKLFLSVKGLTSDGSLTDPDPLECEVKRAMIDRAEESILLLAPDKLADARLAPDRELARSSLWCSPHISPRTKLRASRGEACAFDPWSDEHLTETAYAAVDLGAESGRVMLGRISGGRATLETVHRIPNVPVRLPDGLHWNLLELFAQIRQGLERAAAMARLRGVGIDAWGVDYALLDSERRLLGLPFHYRDPRTEGMALRAHGRVPREEMYAVTGIQTMPINTVFQLLAEESRLGPRVRRPDRPGRRSVRALAHGDSGERGHGRVDHRTARRPEREVGSRAG